MFLKNKILKGGEVLQFLDILQTKQNVTKNDWSASMLRKLARVNDVNTVLYSVDPMQFISFPRIW